MGIAGAGNSGTVACALLAPRLAEHVGWHGVDGPRDDPRGLVLIAFRLLAKEPPAPATRLTLGAFGEMLRRGRHVEAVRPLRRHVRRLRRPVVASCRSSSTTSTA